MRRLSELYEQLTNEKLPEDANTDDIKGRSLRLARVLTRRLLTTTQRAMVVFFLSEYSKQNLFEIINVS